MIYIIFIKNHHGALEMEFDNIDHMFERINDLPPGYRFIEGYIGG
jgi:hypothetical protein